MQDREGTDVSLALYECPHPPFGPLSSQFCCKAVRYGWGQLCYQSGLFRSVLMSHQHNFGSNIYVYILS